MTAEQEPKVANELQPIKLTIGRVVPDSDLPLLGEAGLIHGVVVSKTKPAGEPHVTQEITWTDEGAKQVIRGIIIPEGHALALISGTPQTLPGFWREVEDLRAGRELRLQSIGDHL